MADPDRDTKFTLSYAGNGKTREFATAAEAGRAFAEAEAAQQPRVMDSTQTGVRTIARTVTVGDRVEKSVPRLDSLRKDPVICDDSGAPRSETGKSTLEFWTAYHDRILEKTRDATPSRKQSRHGGDQDGTITPAGRQNSPAAEDRFALPTSYHDRFLVTKTGTRQDLYRAYDDARPAISDKGDQLSTRNADRGTAMDMMELASHRGWQSLKAKGPEEFRREMWIEGTAQGLRVQGYRPSGTDQEEANRRSRLIGDRVLERTDLRRSSRTTGPPEVAADGPATKGNVVRMPRASYSEGLSGKITEIGTAPYRDREGADPVPFVALERETGKTERLWSVTLPETLEKHGLRVGDRATLYSPGVEPVTYRTTDQAGAEIERQGHRRLWEAKEIDRAPDPARASPAHPAPASDIGEAGKTPKPHEPDTKTDRLEDRIKRYAPGDQAAKGPASVLAHMEARLRAEGVPEKDREDARSHAAKLLALAVRNGREVPVQKLANVSREQEAGGAAHVPSARNRQQEDHAKEGRER